MAFSKARRLANLMSTASDSVPASKVNTTIADDAITTAKIADDAITTALIADDAVTSDHLANSINSAITANTAKVTNAITTHTGDVTGAAALTIAVDAVDIPMLSATGTPSSTTFLRGDNSWAVPPGQDTISKVSSAPSVGTEGTMYYNTTTDKMYLSTGSVWVEFDTNRPPTSSGGTVTIAAQGGTSTFSYNLGIDFADVENTDAELAYSLQSGTLPAGAVLPTSGNTALTGTATNTTATYNFVIRATDTKGSIATQAYTQVITAVTIATGGTITTSGGYRYHTFTSSGTFAITAAMNSLTLIVAAIALLASLLAIMQERLPEFAQWRALGVNTREQFLIICSPLLIFVVIAWLLAIPLGAVLSWLLIQKLNIVSFGWSMPMLWKMAPAWQLGGLVLVIVIVTLLLSLLQLRRRLPDALAELGELS